MFTWQRRDEAWWYSLLSCLGRGRGFSLQEVQSSQGVRFRRRGIGQHRRMVIGWRFILRLMGREVRRCGLKNWFISLVK